MRKKYFATSLGKLTSPIETFKMSCIYNFNKLRTTNILCLFKRRFFIYMIYFKNSQRKVASSAHVYIYISFKTNFYFSTIQRKKSLHNILYYLHFLRLTCVCVCAARNHFKPKMFYNLPLLPSLSLSLR